jgi:hypothetical protein
MGRKLTGREDEGKRREGEAKGEGGMWEEKEKQNIVQNSTSE